MSATPSPPDQRFKRRDAASYDSVARSFERLSARYTTPIAHRLAALIDRQGAQRVLDLATGTGVLALALADETRRVVGIDLARQMLASARARVEAEPSWRVDFLPMDAERLAFAAGSFDVVVSLFGLLHFPHPEHALAEAFRVLRPDGRVVVAVGSGPSRRTLAGWLDAAGRLWARALILAGRRLEAPAFLDRQVRDLLPAGDEPEEAELPRRHRDRSGVLPRLLGRAGFVEIHSAWWSETAEVPDAEEFWELQATFSSLARKRLAVAPAGGVARLRRRFDRACAEVLGRGGKLVYPRGVLVVDARKPRSTP